VPSTAGTSFVIDAIRTAMAKPSVVISFGRPSAVPLPAFPLAILAVQAASVAGGPTSRIPRPPPRWRRHRAVFVGGRRRCCDDDAGAARCSACRRHGRARCPAAAAGQLQRNQQICHTCGHYKTGDGKWGKAHRTGSHKKGWSVPVVRRLAKPGCATGASFPLAPGGSSRIPNWRPPLGDV